MNPPSEVRYATSVTAEPTSPAVRRPLRTALRAATGGVLVVVTTLAAPAAATPPEAWADSGQVSAMNFLLVLAIIPLGLAAVISLLALLPSMMSSSSGYQPGLAWRNEPEWFGGRREVKGEDAEAPRSVTGADAEPAGERGGASAHW